MEGLLEATKELNHIDRSNIFYHLLVTYCKADETDKAIGLWTILQEESEVPSKQFLLYLGNHLKSKNREIPFVMPDVEVEKPKKDEKAKAQKLVTSQLPTKNELSVNIENLIKSGKASQAMDLAMKSISKGTMPKTPVMKYLLKVLAEQGNVEKIEQLGNVMTDPLRRRLTYDDKLTLAKFNKGAGAEHIDDLVKAAERANTLQEFEVVLQKFPRSNALASILNKEDVVTKC